MQLELSANTESSQSFPQHNTRSHTRTPDPPPILIHTRSSSITPNPPPIRIHTRSDPSHLHTDTTPDHHTRSRSPNHLLFFLSFFSFIFLIFFFFPSHTADLYLSSLLSSSPCLLPPEPKPKRAQLFLLSPFFSLYRCTEAPPLGRWSPIASSSEHRAAAPSIASLSRPEHLLSSFFSPSRAFSPPSAVSSTASSHQTPPPLASHSAPSRHLLAFLSPNPIPPDPPQTLLFPQLPCPQPALHHTASSTPPPHLLCPRLDPTTSSRIMPIHRRPRARSRSAHKAPTAPSSSPPTVTALIRPGRASSSSSFQLSWPRSGSGPPDPTASSCATSTGR